MKSRFLIFTLFLAVMCVGGASNAIAQSVTGTGVFNAGNGGPPVTITVSSSGGSGGVMRFGAPGPAQEGTQRGELTGQPVDMCVQGNTAFVLGQITHSSGDFAGVDGQFMVFGFVDNGKDGDAVLVFIGGFIFPEVGPACELFGFPLFIPIPVERGGFQVKSS